MSIKRCLSVLLLALVVAPLAGQGCATASDTFWQRDTLPMIPSGATAVGVIRGMCEGESIGVVFEVPANTGPQQVTQVVAPWGAAGGIAGFQAVLDLEVYDGVDFSSGIVDMGTRVFSLSQSVSGSLQVQSHGLNAFDTSAYNIVVGNAPPNGTPLLRRFAICFRCDLNLHPNGTCATGYPANFFTDTSQVSLFCNPALTPARTSLIEYYDGGAYAGWRDVTTATVGGIPICGIYYQGTWAVRCCTRDAFPASYSTFGPGCAGTMATSTLQPLAMPRIGTTMNVIVNNLPSNLCIWVTGWSNQISSFGPLPFDATPLGAPGCLLRVSSDLPQLLVANNHIVLTSLTLPSAPGIVGLGFFQQALVFDAPANALGAVASDAVAAVIGS